MMDTCAVHRRADCGCPDPIWQGVVIIDDRSEPGSWKQHIADTECMRSSRPVPHLTDRTSSGGAALSRPASVVGGR